MARKFGAAKGSGGRYVCDLANKLALGVRVMAPGEDGRRKLRTVVSLGQPFERDGQIYIYGYLSDDYTSRSELRNRHWTPKQLALLPAPEKTESNPVRETAPPTQLWLDATVARVERSSAFKALVRTPEIIARQRASAQKAADTQRAAAMAAVDAISLKVRTMGDDTVRKHAIHAFNERADVLYGERGTHVGPATADSDPAFLDRITVDYIRYRLTKYDRHHRDLDGRFGHVAARELMKDRVFDAIAEAYPRWSAEAVRQRDERRPGFV